MATKTPVTTLISNDTRQVLETISRRQERSLSQIIREAVNQYIQNAA